MMRFPYVAATAVLCLGACGSGNLAGPTPQAADTTRIMVDNTVSLQSVAGFGGTTLTLVFPNGDHLGSYRNAAIQRAFGEIGVSLGLLSIGTAETPATASDRFGQRANDNGDPFTSDPAGFNFTDSDLLRTKILQPAAAYGFSDLTLGPFLNVRYTLDWMQPIRGVAYSRYLDEAAENVLAVVQHWRDAYGLTPRLVDLFNEPTSGNVELASSSTQEVVDLVARAGARLQAAGFSGLKFLVPNEETIQRSLQVAQAILADPAARPYVGVIGYHPYPYGSVYASPARILATSGSGVPDPATRQQLEQLKALGQQYGVPVWMTEVSEGPGNSDFAFDAIENVLARAIHIHDNFTYAGAAAFFGMHTLWDSQSHAEHFAGRNIPFLSEKSGMVLVDTGAGQILTTGMGYAVGHYARWLKPGTRVIEATSDKPRVVVTAFRDQAKSRLVLVTVNNEASSQLLRVQLNGASPRGEATGEVSYGTVRWGPISGISPTAGNEILYVAPPHSVVTLAIPIT